MLGAGNPFFSAGSYHRENSPFRGSQRNFTQFVSKHDAEFKRILAEAKTLTNNDKSDTYQEVYELSLTYLRGLHELSCKTLNSYALSEMDYAQLTEKTGFAYKCLLMAERTLDSLRISNKEPFLGKGFSLEAESTSDDSSGIKLQEIKSRR